MKRITATVAIAAATVCAFGLTSEFSRGNRASSQIAYLTIDGTKHELLVGQETQLTIGDTQHAVKITLDPFRLFSAAGFTFKHPSQMGVFEDASDPLLHFWSINGDNSLILVQKYGEPIGKNLLIGGLRDEYRAMNAEISSNDIRLEGKNQTLEGTKLTMRMGNISLMQEVYVFNKGPGTVAIILQDLLDEQRNNTAEFVALRKAFAESFEIKK